MLTSSPVRMLALLFFIQLATGATADDGCSFDVDAISGMVVGCNFSESHPLDRVQPWRMGVASQAFWLGGPLFDATNSSQGGYAFFDTSTPSGRPRPAQQARGWLKSPVYPPTTPRGRCLHFSYNIDGASAMELKVLRVQLVPADSEPAANSILMASASTEAQNAAALAVGRAGRVTWNGTIWNQVIDPIWLNSDPTGGRWNDAHVTFSSPYRHAFIFEGVPNPSRAQYAGYVAIDDVTFSDGPCKYECEFNVDFCGWSNVEETIGEDDFDWALSRGSLSTHTGPVRDQLSSNNYFNFGGYAFIDSRVPHYAGSRARLTSPTIVATSGAGSSGPLCLAFWVHMFGQGIGQLRLIKRPVGAVNATQETEIWRLSNGGPRTNWFRAQVVLSSAKAFTVTIEAVVGETGYGDIAIDSLRIEDGACPGLPEGAIPDGNADCNFESGNCRWYITNSHAALSPLWRSTSSEATPQLPRGHVQRNVLTQGPGNYLSFDTHRSGIASNLRGFASSPWLAASNQKRCLAFWVNQAAASVTDAARLGALELVLYEPNTTSAVTATDSPAVKFTSLQSTPLWRLENHQSDAWIYSQVSFRTPVGGFVSFAGIRGAAVAGTMALDDVVLYTDEDCPTKPALAEVSNVDCSFDGDMCSWKVDSDQLRLAATTTTTSTISPPIRAEDPADKGRTETETQAIASSVDPTNTATSSTATILATVSTEKSTSVPTSESTSEPASPSTSEPTSEPASFSTSESTSTETWTSAPIADSVDSEDAFTIQENAMTTMPTSEYTTESTSESPSTSTPVLSLSVVPLSPTPDAATTKVPATLASTVAVVTSSTSTTTTPSPSKSIFRSNSLTTKKSAPSGVELSLKAVRLDPSQTSSSGGDFDSVVSFGANQIEILGVGRNGASKTIIISRPTGRSFHDHDAFTAKRSRGSRILSQRSSDAQRRDRFQTRPGPVRAQGYITPYWLSQSPSASSSNSAVQIGRTGPLLVPASSPSVAGPWRLATGDRSLASIFDHTFQQAQGGYAYLEGSSAGDGATSRMFSTPLAAADADRCLTFFYFFGDAGVGSSLAVYAQQADTSSDPARLLWRGAASSKAAPRFGWHHAQVPLVGNATNQVLVIEGQGGLGGLAIDDIRLRRHRCPARPEKAAEPTPEPVPSFRWI